MAATTMVVSAEQISYTGETPITITGSMSPPPSSTVFATVVVKNPLGAALVNTQVPMNSFGVYQLTILAGCTPDWTPGTYNVTGSATSLGETSSASSTFEYYLGLVPVDKVSAMVAPQIVLGGANVTVSGTVAACSGSVAPTNVLIIVKNPNGIAVFQDEVTPKGPAAFGNYTDSFVAGGTLDWTPGVYTVTSQFRSSSNPPTPAVATAVFNYSLAGSSVSSSARQSAQTPSSSVSMTGLGPGTSNQFDSAYLVPVAAIAAVGGIGIVFLVIRGRRRTKMP
jgi:hypothetical protein